MSSPLPDDAETWTVDGLTLGTTDGGVFYAVEKVTGWDASSKPRSARIAKVGAHGSYRSPAWRSEGVYTLEGWATVDTEPTALAVRDRLAGLCSNPYLLYELRHVDALSGEDRTAMVELDDAVLVDIVYGERPLRIDFSLQFASPDPRKHGQPQSAQGTLPTPATGGLNASPPGLNASAPGLDAGTPGGLGFVTVTNTGTAPAWPLITFAGNGSSLPAPSLTNQATGDVITYTGTLAANESVVINCDEFPCQGYPERSVLLQGTADRGNLLALVGDWPVVPPGASVTFLFRATSYNALSTVTVELRPAFW